MGVIKVRLYCHIVRCCCGCCLIFVKSLLTYLSFYFSFYFFFLSAILSQGAAQIQSLNQVV